MIKQKILTNSQLIAIQTEFRDSVFTTPNSNIYWMAKLKIFKITITIFKNQRLLIQGSNENLIKFATNTKLFWKKLELWEDNLLNPVIKSSYATYCWGGDESGKGDYFGSIHLTLVNYTESMKMFCQNLKIHDSKKLSESVIKLTAAKIIKNFPNAILTATIIPAAITKQTNLNQLLSEKYWELIQQIKQVNPIIIIDGFTTKTLFKSYLKHHSLTNIANLELITKAEHQFAAVAIASIISRYHFLQELEAIDLNYKIKLKRGASGAARTQAETLLNQISTPTDCKKLIKQSFLTKKLS